MKLRITMRMNNEDRYKRDFVKVLIGFFICSCFSFIYPLFSIILLENGLNATEAGYVQGAGFLSSIFFLPKIGEQIDRGNLKYLVPFAVFGFVTGALCFFTKTDLRFLLVKLLVGSVLFVGASGIVVTITKRFTEGLASRIHLTKAASLTYFTENFAVTFSAILGYYFLHDFKFQLVIIDIVVKILFLMFMFLLGAREAKDMLLNRNLEKRLPSGKGIKSKISGVTVLRLIGIAFVLVTVLCHVSAIPVLFYSNGLDAKKMTSFMLGINTCSVLTVTFFLARTKINFNPYLLFVIGTLLSSVGHCFMPIALNHYSIGVLTLIWSMGEGLIYPAITTLILREFDIHEAGRGVAVKTVVWRSALVIAPLLSAMIQSLPRYFFSVVFSGVPLVGICLYFISFHGENKSYERN